MCGKTSPISVTGWVSLPSYVMLTEVNEFNRPGPDLRPVEELVSFMANFLRISIGLFAAEF